jgi:PAS domain S-box-containing protein
MKILIVEDNRDSRNLLSKQLRAFGYETITADNGVEALKQALEDIPDIMVSDIQMPVMDGYQLCREWKQNEKLKDIPVVFYTATYTSQEDEKFALNLGAAAFIRKPTEPDILVKILSEIIEKAGSGLLSPPEVKPLEQYEYLVEHNKRLVAKLQKKIEDLNLEVSEHKETETELKVSEERLRSTLDAMMEGYQIIGNDYSYLYINPVAAAQGRNDRNKYYGHTMMELYPGIEETDVFRRIQRCMQENRPDRMENEFTYPDGTKAWFDLSIEPVPEGVLMLSVDISKRKEAESDVLRINRMLRTISECNQLLVRATDEKELLDKICDLIVSSEGYPMAWVGFAENDEEKTVRPVALAGGAEEYLNGLKVSWADNEFGKGPTGIAIRTGKPCIARHGTADSNYPRWRASAIKYGFNSSIALPLISNGTNIGSLNIYAREEDAFD